MWSMERQDYARADMWRGTTIVSVRRGKEVVIAGDGQVSMGPLVLKSNAKKVRRLGKDGTIIAGFAGATADAFTLFARLEAKLEAHPGQLTRACVELAKDWRTDKYLRRLEALMAVADAGLDALRCALIAALEADTGIGPDALAANLRVEGHAKVMDDMDSTSVYIRAPFAAPGSDPSVVAPLWLERAAEMEAKQEQRVRAHGSRNTG